MILDSLVDTIEQAARKADTNSGLVSSPNVFFTQKIAACLIRKGLEITPRVSPSDLDELLICFLKIA